MAIYMASMKSISRSRGQSAVASAAYRSGKKLEDKRYGKTQNYENRDGILSATIILPQNLKHDSALSKLAVDREDLWNLAEAVEKRKDSRIAREWVVNLPHELPADTRQQLAHEFSQALCDKYGVIADCCLHQPSAKEVARGADPRNFHAHIMLTTRQAQFDKTGELVFGEKASIELSDSKRRSLGMTRVSDEIIELRQLWEQIANRYLVQYGIELIDSRSYADRDIDLMPEIKMGKHATQMERDGIATEKGDLNRLIRQRNQEVTALYELATTSSQYRIAETQRAIATNTAAAPSRQGNLEVVAATLDDNARTVRDSQQRVATTQSAIADTERTIADNTAESQRRADQTQRVVQAITKNTARLENSQSRITNTESIVAQITTATERNTERTTQAKQRITELSDTATGTARFIDQSKQSLSRTYTAHLDNPRAIDRLERQTAQTDNRTRDTNQHLDRAAGLIDRTKPVLAEFNRTIQAAYHRFTQYRAKQIALETHRKALEKQKQENDRQVAKDKKMAENARQAQINVLILKQQQDQAHAQETTARRQGFENVLMPHIVQHFAQIEKTGVEFHYPFENYALYRAVKAITQLHTAAEQGDTSQLLTAFEDYRLAIKGDGVTRNDRQTNELAREGELGMLQKFRQRDIHGYTHYEWNKPEHMLLKLQAIEITQHCQAQVKVILDHALSHEVINASQQQAMVETLSQLDSSLTSHEKEATKEYNRFAHKLDKGNSYRP